MRVEELALPTGSRAVARKRKVGQAPEQLRLALPHLEARREDANLAIDGAGKIHHVSAILGGFGDHVRVLEVSTHALKGGETEFLLCERIPTVGDGTVPVLQAILHANPCRLSELGMAGVVGVERVVVAPERNIAECADSRETDPRFHKDEELECRIVLREVRGNSRNVCEILVERHETELSADAEIPVPLGLRNQHGIHVD